MEKETFKIASDLMTKIIGVENSIASWEKDLDCLEKKRYFPSVKAEVKLEYKYSDSYAFHNFSIEISEETIKKEIKNRIFTLKNQLFVLNKNLESL